MKFMKTVFTILCFMILHFGLNAQQRYDLNFNFDGHARNAIIVVPNSPPPAGGYPIVIMLHGTGQDGEWFYETSGWKELGATENFITVFPTSLQWCYVDNGVERNNYRWVNGNVTENPCSGPPQDYVDDVKFLKKLVTIISDTLPVNAAKIFASGFSNGSAMIHKLANDAGDVFAAVAGSGASLTMSDSVIPVHRIPVWYVLGSLDDRYIVPPYTELPFGGDSILVYLNKPIRRALTCQGVTEAFEKFETPITHTYRFSESTTGGTSNSPYLFTLVKGMYHVYPNGSNFPLSAPEIFWDFFNRSVMVSTGNEKESEDLLNVFPNPSKESIQVSINNENGSKFYHFTLMNSLGQTIYEGQSMDSNFTLNKNETGSGLFILQLQIGKKLINKKILFE
jgi:predicted esterase